MIFSWNDFEDNKQNMNRNRVYSIVKIRQKRSTPTGARREESELDGQFMPVAKLKLSKTIRFEHQVSLEKQRET